ncbi:ligase-associated DNA damage response endonuclease PdeM [Luteimonas mephitis]|uniref:ligase-associated DNA damage response endonuclease PdeM n=1 Tax=Luteimonas mephitis TaxID=83615 RepID=UPI0004107228|nr:ligase-associated DNA damage response endonuclease PdeM [Luteimonas mephitis]
MDALDVHVEGERLRLLAGRALFWPARSRLMLADLHLGKGDILRAAGIPVPSGGTRADLARLDALLAATGARELWILGDFLHGRRGARVDAAWRAWRHAHADCAVAVIAGNHDRALDAAAAGVDALADATVDGPFVFRHAPAAGGPGRFVVCGHVHPVVRLPGLPGRHPAFWRRSGVLVLPAFSAFTGGHLLPPRECWVACTGGMLVDHRPSTCA